MQFQSVKIRNFLSIGSAELDFTPGVHLLCGRNDDMGSSGDESNGAGKSSIFDAIGWALFGTVGREGCKAGDVVNRSVKKDCLVELRFINGADQILIRRTRAHTEHGNSLMWSVNGDERAEHRTGDTQKDLESYLPISESVFNYAVQVGQGMPHRFLSLSETAKQDLLCEVMDLSIYDESLERAKDLHARACSDLTSVTMLISSQTLTVEGWRGTLAKYEQDLINFRSSSSFDADQARADIDQHQANILAYREFCTNHEAIRPGLTNEDTELDAKTQALRSQVSKISSEKYKLDGEIKNIERQRHKYASLGDVCATCMQKVDTAHVQKHTVELDALLASYKVSVLEKEEAISLYQETITGFEAHRAQVQDSIRELDRLIKQALTEIGQESAKISVLQSMLNQNTREETIYTTKIDQIKKMIEEEERHIAQLTAQSDEASQRARHRAFWKDSIPNLRAAAVGDVLKYLNERVSYYLDIFADGAMGVNIYQEQYGKGSKIKVDLRTPGGNYGMSSGGERRRVDLSLYLALADLTKIASGVQINLLVADEIMDGLSPSGVGKFLSVLRAKAEDGMCVYTVSHNPAIRGLFEFDSTLLVAKTDGRSTLEIV